MRFCRVYAKSGLGREDENDCDDDVVDDDM
jgi:hypothetical protein